MVFTSAVLLLGDPWIGRWMGLLMDGLMGEWMTGCVDGWIDIKINDHMPALVDGFTNR